MRYSEVYKEEGGRYVLDQAVFESSTEYLVMHRDTQHVFEFEVDEVKSMLEDADLQ